MDSTPNLPDKDHQTQIKVNNFVSATNITDFPTLEESYGVLRSVILNPRNEEDRQKRLIVDGTACSVDYSAGVSSLTDEEGKVTGSSAGEKQWRELFPKSRVVKSSPLKYTSPVEVEGKLCVSAKSDTFAEGLKSCKDLVIGSFVGKRLSFAAVHVAAGKIWKFTKEVTIKLYGDSVFVFDFLAEEDRNLVLTTGSVYISNKLFILRPWSQLIEKKIAEVKSVPIWVMIYGVPLHMWNTEGLGIIASFLGKPLFADDCTLNQTRLAYARVCVEIGVDFVYPSSIPLLLDDTQMDLSVEYQWKAVVCNCCKVFGHSEKSCVKQKKNRWVPKKVCKPLVLAKNSEFIQQGAEIGYDPTAGSMPGDGSPKGDIHSTNIEIVNSETVDAGRAERDNPMGSQVHNCAIIGESTEVSSKVVQLGNQTSSSTKRVIAEAPAGVGLVGYPAKEGASTGIQGDAVGAKKIDKLLLVEKEGEWTEVKGKTKSSPKKNPFFMKSDFPYLSKSRFPLESKKQNQAEVESSSKSMLTEEAKLKKKDKELARLHWEGSPTVSREGNTDLGRGGRSQKR